MTDAEEAMTDKLTVEQLLPCAFCGGEGETLSVAYNRAAGLRWWGIECECGAHGPSDDTEADAIAAWNTRASLTPPVADTPTGDPNYRRRGSDATVGLRPHTAAWYFLDLYRIIRAAGRSDRAKAQSAAEYVAVEVSAALALKADKP